MNVLDRSIMKTLIADNFSIVKKFTIEKLLIQREASVAFALILLCIILGTLTPTFLTSYNLLNVARQISLYAIIAVGETFVITSGGIDLSVGAVLALAGVITTLISINGIDPWIAVFVGLLVGIGCGYTNGFLISKARINPFIVTLGMLNIARGIVLVITRGYPIPIYAGPVVYFGQGYIGPIPVPVIFMLIIGVIGIILLRNTILGNYVKALGSNEPAARAMGINVERIKAITYTLAGFLSGLAGVVLAGRLSAGQPNAGIGWELDCIAAVIIGGTSLTGGEGSVIGTLIGATLLGVIRNGLVLVGVSMYWQTVVIGLILIGGVALDRFTKARSE